MNERQLKIFYEVATRLSMTEAANNLFMTQPAVSQAIKDLEQEFGLNFFDRIGKRLYLTSDGEILFSYARRILNLYDECVKEIKSVKDLESGSLRIGASTTIGIYVLTDIIGKYTKENKNIDVSITIENTNNVANLILENKVDFAYVEGPVHSKEIAVEEFCDDELVIITSVEHPFSMRKTIDIKELEKEKIIMREKGSGTREVFENILIANNLKINRFLELGNTEAIKKSVEANLGVSCISKRAIKDEIKNNKLACVLVDNVKISRKLNIIYHKDKTLSNLFKAFMTYSKEKV